MIDRETDLPLPVLVNRRALAQPDRVVVRSVEHGDVTYAALDELSRRWAGLLASHGVGAGDTVLTLVPNSPIAIAIWIGAAWLRAIEAPMNVAYRGEWVTHVVRNSAAKLAVVREDHLPILLDVAETLTDLKTILVVGRAPESMPAGIRLVSTPNDISDPVGTDAAPGREDIACVVYTSGTTGPSKGVMVTWAQAHFSAIAPVVPDRLRGPDDVYYAPFGPYHWTGKSPIYGAAIRNAAVVIRERFSTNAFWDDIKAFGCRGTLLVGAMANFLHRQPERPDDGETPLRYVLMAPVIAEVEDFRRRFKVEVFTCFNMTEISTPLLNGPEGVRAEKQATCGRVRPGYTVEIRDEAGGRCASGEPGELWVKPDDPLWIAKGYFAMPDKTAEAFGDGWFRTGDLFKKDEDGDYYFLDRIKDYIRRRGENISSFEIEATVNTFPAVLESAAVAVPSEWSEDEVKIAVTPKAGAVIDPAELHAYLRLRMPQFAVPRFIEIVEALPRTPTERIQKAVVRSAGMTSATWDAAKAQTHGGTQL